MSPLPYKEESILRTNLLRWVELNPGKPFDRRVGVSLSAGRWEWKVVIKEMELMERMGFISKLKPGRGTKTYWDITPVGLGYLAASEDIESREASRKTQWDVFISHASEDKEAIARRLAEALKSYGLSVWY